MNKEIKVETAADTEIKETLMEKLKKENPNYIPLSNKDGSILRASDSKKQIRLYRGRTNAEESGILKAVIKKDKETYYITEALFSKT